MSTNGRRQQAGLARVAVVSGVRTPFTRAGTLYRDLTPVELARLTLVELMHRASIAPEDVDHVVLGNVIPSIHAPNVAREAALGAGVSPRTPAFTVNRACASSNTAITSCAEAILSGHAEVAIGGGVEMMSDVPILWAKPMRKLLIAASKAKGIGAKLGLFARIRPRFFVPEAPAIAEFSTGLSMGQSCEKMAKDNHISRAAQDELAWKSHMNAAKATDDGRMKDETFHVIVPPRYEEVAVEDNGIRRDSTVEALSQLRPVFDRRYGTITAGNSSGLTDGASAVLLMAEDKARAEGRKPLGVLRSWAYAAIDPRDQLLLGPAYAVPDALERAGLTLKDMDLVEMHEAFAAQVLSTTQALASRTFAVEKLGRDEPVGEVDPAKLNTRGGSIAIGHPFGATGARLVMSTLLELGRLGKQFGLVTVCAAGGMGVAMVVERV